MFFAFLYESTSGICFSESARKMTQNGGRVVAIGSIFDMNMSFDVRNMEKMWTTELLVVGDLNIAYIHIIYIRMHKYVYICVYIHTCVYIYIQAIRTVLIYAS